jgi:GNAT superfamily N-acetyltransferase
MPDVRRATSADARAAAGVYLAARTGAGTAIPPGIHTEREVHIWMADVVVPNKEVWVAERRTVDGLLVLDGTEVEMLYVHPRAQGHGLGSLLLAQAKTLRPNGLALWTFQSNRHARHFYEDRGFVAVRHTDGDNEEGAPDVRYVWGTHPERTTG